ncbi:hypothetical protein, partial [Rhizobium johnstonii]|uniref:hypothetical protein n=2 Tax=Rhizobium johnstonii TaxID=3019933 RepID=UPI003F9642C6
RTFRDVRKRYCHDPHHPPWVIDYPILAADAFCQAAFTRTAQRSERLSVNRRTKIAPLSARNLHPL